MEAKLNDTDEDVGVFNIGRELFWWYRDAQGLWLLYHVHDLDSIWATPPNLARLRLSSGSDSVGVASTGVSLRSMARGHLAQDTRPA